MEEMNYWVKCGDMWYIATHAWDDEEDRMAWYSGGMEILKEPDEIGDRIIRVRGQKSDTGEGQLTVVISRFKTDLDKWIDGSKKAAGNLRDIGHQTEAQNFDGQATAYWAVKNYLEVNGL